MIPRVSRYLIDKRVYNSRSISSAGESVWRIRVATPACAWLRSNGCVPYAKFMTI
jgi:hypothetical protein